MNAQQKSNLAAGQLQDSERIARMIAAGADRSTIQSEWERMVVGAVTSGVPFDVDAVVQQIIRQAYLETTDDLRFYVGKVKDFNTAKKTIRQYTRGLQDRQSATEKEQEFARLMAEIQRDLITHASEIIKNLKR